MYTVDVDGDTTTSPESQRAAEAYSRDIVVDAWGIDPFVEAGRSSLTKPSAYARLLVNNAGISGPTRRITEILINRELKKRHLKGDHSEFHLDAIKGTTSFIADNPRYSQEYASELDPDRHRMVVDMTVILGSPCWIFRHEARRVVRRLGYATSENEAEAFLANYPRDWVQVTRQQAYQAHKLFYGLGPNGTFNSRARITYDERLEPTIRHCGTLVTAPCFGRPHDVGRFAAFMEHPAITWRRWIRILPREQVLLLVRHRDATRAGNTEDCKQIEREALRAARSSSAPSVAAAPLGRTRSTTVHHGSQQTAIHGPASPSTGAGVDAMSAMREAARWFMRRCNGDKSAATAATVSWYEGPSGPATGHSPQEHDERVNRVVRYIDRLPEFDPTHAGSHGGLWVTRERVAAMADEMRRFISDELIQLNRADGLSHEVIAAVYGILLRGVSTLAEGYGPETLQDVGVGAIQGMLRELHMSRSRKVIADALRLLQGTRLILKTRNSFTPFAPPFETSVGTGRCRAWLVNTARYCPEWAKDNIPAASQIAAIAEAVRSVSVPSLLIREEYGTSPPTAITNAGADWPIRDNTQCSAIGIERGAAELHPFSLSLPQNEERSI